MTDTVSVDWFVALSGLLFAVGMAGVLVRRNALVVLLSIEIMLNAANLALVAFSRMHAAHDGQVLAITVMAIVMVALLVYVRNTAGSEVRHG